MLRRQFLGSSLAGVAAVGLERFLPPADSSAATVYPWSVNGIRTMAAAIKQTDMTAGGTHEYGHAMAQARHAINLLDVYGTRPERIEATSWLVTNTAFVAFDAGKLDDALTLNDSALGMAQEVGNASLRARILGSMARNALWEGRHAEAVQMLDAARRIDGLTPREHAMLWALTARASAVAGDVYGVERAAALGDELLAEGGATEDRPWVGHYNQAHHDGDIASAYQTLVLEHGARRVVDATMRQRRASDAHDPTTAARSQALSMVGLSITDIAVGNVEYGIATGIEAVGHASGIQSWRLKTKLRRLLATVDRYDVSGAKQLAADIRPLIA